MSAVANLDLRMLALQHANDIRRERAVLKRQLRAMSLKQGCGLVAGLLDECPSWLVSMEIWDLLMMIREMRKERVREMLRLARVGVQRPVGGMSKRQVGVLSGLLRARAGVER